MQRTLGYIALLTLFLMVGCGGKPTAPATPQPTLTQPVKTIPSGTPTAQFPVAIQIEQVAVFQPEYETALNQVKSAQSRTGVPLSEDEQRAKGIAGLSDELLLASGALENGFQVDESALKAEQDQLVQAAGGLSQFDAWQSANGYTKDMWDHTLRLSLESAWMTDKILSSVPDAVEQARVRQIVVADQAQAQKILDQASQPGADFNAMAYEFDPYSGGDLGWFPRGYLLEPAVEEAAFSLQAGQFAPLIHTALGWHILRLTAKATQPLSQDARLTLEQIALRDWLDQRRASAHFTGTINLSSLPAPVASTAIPSEGQPFYRIQAGDTLFTIASGFRVPLQALTDANPGIDPSALAVGQELVIPGVVGAHEQIFTVEVPPGTTLRSLARAYRIPESILAELNRLTSPAQLFAGAWLALPATSTDSNGHAGLPDPFEPLQAVQKGENILQAAASSAVSPWDLALLNEVDTPDFLLPGDALYGQSVRNAGSTNPAPDVTITKLPLVQGQTYRLHVTSQDAPSGTLDGHHLNFFQSGNEWVAYQGIYALAEPGVSLLSLKMDPDGQAQGFEESLPLYSGNFPKDPPLQVDAETIDPQITGPEDQQVFALVATATPDKAWNGAFRPPTDSPGCTRSKFGDLRSFNGSDYIYFHSGLDYGVCAGTNIFAPADGKVVFAGKLDVRGNAVIIDHGWGVYSGYWHQQELIVKVGDEVKAGDVIGIIGDTGRVTGAHLHWEVFVGGVQVNPEEWLANDFSGN